MFTKSLLLRPHVIVIAFYSGNDPLETFTVVYSTDKWAGLKIGHHIDPSDKPPSVGFPPPGKERWTAAFADGTNMVFTPSLRLMSNDTDYAVVEEGWAIMAKVASEINQLATSFGVALVYTIIPSKELVYAEKIRKSAVQPPPAYHRLIDRETRNITRLAESFQHFANVTYVDVITPLQQAAFQGMPIYPHDINGHPYSPDYRVIGEAVAPIVRQKLNEQRNQSRLVRLPAQGEPRFYFLLDEQSLRAFASESLVQDKRLAFRPSHVTTGTRIHPSSFRRTCLACRPRAVWSACHQEGLIGLHLSPHERGPDVESGSPARGRHVKNGFRVSYT
jgi:hypothetical protein